MTEKHDYGYRTDRGWHFDDLYTFKITSHSAVDLAKVRDDYLGAFKPPDGGQTHPTGLGTVPGTTTQAASAPRSGLIVKIAATHAGLITRNNGFYLPDKMRAAASTWTEHYNKPIQLHHDSHNDPIGRVIAARYVDTSIVVSDQFKNSVLRDGFNNNVGVADQKFWNKFTSDKTSFIDKLNMLKLMDSVLNDPHYQGVGYIELTAHITDPDAISKILDGRYMTGSVGAVSDKAVCSICNTDWLEEDHCGHRPGVMYDGKKCVVVAGNLEYDEYSFVNTPADRHSGIKEYELIQNSVHNSTDGAIKYYPLFNSLKEDSTMSANTETTTIKDSAQVSETVAPVESQPAEVPVADATVSTENVTDASTPAQEPTIDDLVNELLDKLFKDGLSEEEHGKLYELQLAEMDKDVVEDAKLSTARRKKLASSTFCGPGRSFPVPDCAHVTAARRLIGRYKGEGSKESILACVARKAKAMGCDSTASTVKDEVQDQVQEAVTPVQEVVPVPVEHDFTFASKVVGDVTDQVKFDLSKNFLTQLVERFGKDSLQAAVLELGLAINPEQVTALEAEVARSEEIIGDLRDQLSILRKELKAAYDDVVVVEDQLIAAREATRISKADKLQLLHTLDGTLTDEVKSSLAQLTDEALDTTINSLAAKVDINKIADRLNNGLSRTPDEKVEAPVGLTEPITEAKLTNKPTFATQQMVDDVYRRVLLSQGYSAAIAYYNDAVKQGLATPKQ